MMMRHESFVALGPLAKDMMATEPRVGDTFKKMDVCGARNNNGPPGDDMYDLARKVEMHRALVLRSISKFYSSQLSNFLFT
jgi:hypothetical protein